MMEQAAMKYHDISTERYVHFNGRTHLFSIIEMSKEINWLCGFPSPSFKLTLGSQDYFVFFGVRGFSLDGSKQTTKKISFLPRRRVSSELYYIIYIIFFLEIALYILTHLTDTVINRCFLFDRFPVLNEVFILNSERNCLDELPKW